MPNQAILGAGDGNRTRVASLENFDHARTRVRKRLVDGASANPNLHCNCAFSTAGTTRYGSGTATVRLRVWDRYGTSGA